MRSLLLREYHYARSVDGSIVRWSNSRPVDCRRCIVGGLDAPGGTTFALLSFRGTRTLSRSCEVLDQRSSGAAMLHVSSVGATAAHRPLSLFPSMLLPATHQPSSTPLTEKHEGLSQKKEAQEEEKEDFLDKKSFFTAMTPNEKNSSEFHVIHSPSVFDVFFRFKCGGCDFEFKPHAVQSFFTSGSCTCCNTAFGERSLSLTAAPMIGKQCRVPNGLRGVPQLKISLVSAAVSFLTATTSLLSVWMSFCSPSFAVQRIPVVVLLYFTRC